MTVEWQNQQCHRSASSGQVRAAKRIENGDPHTSVTFVHLACSGARLYRGVLGPYAGVEEGFDDLPPQIDRVAELAAAREVDALFVSIGGNDVNFANVIEACILGEDCHEAPVLPDPCFTDAVDGVCSRAGAYETDCLDYLGSLLGDVESLDAKTIFDVHAPSEDDEQGMDLRQDGIDDLPDGYRALSEAIALQLGMDPDGVYLTGYPEVATDEWGRYCGWDTAPIFEAAVTQVPGISQREMRWADQYVAAGLRVTMTASAEELGWRYVGGIGYHARYHGYCSNDPWVVRLHESFIEQGDYYGVLHPNEAGHGSYATQIVKTFLE